MRILILTAIIFFSANAFLAQKNKKNKSELTNEIDSVSYSLGMNMAIALQRISEINYEQFISRLNDNTNENSTSKINQADVQMIIQNYFMKKQQIKQAAEKKNGS